MDTNAHSCEFVSSFAVRVPRARRYVKYQQTLVVQHSENTETIILGGVLN